MSEDQVELGDQEVGAATNYQPYVRPPRPTGRRLVFFHEGVTGSEAAASIRNATGSDVVVPSEMGSMSASIQAASSADSIVILERFGVAAIGGGDARASALANELQRLDMVEHARPEFWMFSTGGPPWADTAATTWGVEATLADKSRFDGSGVRVAVLDTGLDLGHPDFAGRVIVAESFVPFETVDDVQGHGTHCAGTAVGQNRSRGNVPRYGVAPGADLHVAKVLNNKGSGREADIVAGIEWALDKECAIISMSLGRPVAPDEAHDPFYERVAKRCLAAGTLIIAAAGNESERRYNYIAPVGSPANAPSIMAVAAIGADELVAGFSCGGVGTGEIDIAAPGVGVLSSVPRPEFFAKLRGTSMACPHVAGIAALWAQSDPSLRGQALWNRLKASVRPIGGANRKRDFGAGLVQAP
jgi:subtilisin family serine protease